MPITPQGKDLNEAIRHLVEHNEVTVKEGLVIYWYLIRYHHAKLRMLIAKQRFKKRAKKLQDAIDPIQFRLQMTDM